MAKSVFWALALLSVLLLVPAALAEDSSATTDADYYDWQHICVAVAAGLVGLLLVFAGYRLFHLALFLAGATLGGLGLWQIMVHNSELPAWAIYTIAAVGALVIGGVAIALYWFGVFLVGAAAGAGVAAAILGLGFTASDTVLYATVGTAALVGGLVATFFSKVALVVLTSLLGSVSVTLSVGYGIKTYTPEIVSALLSMSFGGLKTLTFDSSDWRPYTLIAICVLLLAVGVVVQLRVTGRTHKHQPLHQHFSSRRRQHQYLPLQNPTYYSYYN